MGDDCRLCGSIVGDFLPVQLIYEGKSNQCLPQLQVPINMECDIFRQLLVQRDNYEAVH